MGRRSPSLPQRWRKHRADSERGHSLDGSDGTSTTDSDSTIDSDSIDGTSDDHGRGSDSTVGVVRHRRRERSHRRRRLRRGDRHSSHRRRRRHRHRRRSARKKLWERPQGEGKTHSGHSGSADHLQSRHFARVRTAPWHQQSEGDTAENGVAGCVISNVATTATASTGDAHTTLLDAKADVARAETLRRVVGRAADLGTEESLQQLLEWVEADATEACASELSEPANPGLLNSVTQQPQPTLPQQLVTCPAPTLCGRDIPPMGMSMSLFELVADLEREHNARACSTVDRAVSPSDQHRQQQRRHAAALNSMDESCRSTTAAKTQPPCRQHRGGHCFSVGQLVASPRTVLRRRGGRTRQRDIR